MGQLSDALFIVGFCVGMFCFLFGWAQIGQWCEERCQGDEVQAEVEIKANSRHECQVLNEEEIEDTHEIVVMESTHARIPLEELFGEESTQSI